MTMTNFIKIEDDNDKFYESIGVVLLFAHLFVITTRVRLHVVQ
jgi:hypothetical protein